MRFAFTFFFGSAALDVADASVALATVAIAIVFFTVAAVLSFLLLALFSLVYLSPCLHNCIPTFRGSL